MWMLPLYLHIDQKSDYDMIMISHGAFCQRVMSICSNGSALLNKMAAMPIYGKMGSSPLNRMATMPLCG